MTSSTDADVAICGAGPIGATTAYFLRRTDPGLNIVLISDDAPAAYDASGGSIRWTWSDPVKREMTTETARFVQGLIDDGVDLTCVANGYHLLHTGQYIPALNISGSRLVDHLISSAGPDRLAGTTVTGVRPDGSGHVIDTSRGTVRAGRVLLALGAVGNARIVPAHAPAPEKRQLFVLDLPVGPDRAGMPHTVVPLGGGFAYVFVKVLDGRLRVLVGQEDVVADDDPAGPVDYWTQLLGSGLGTVMPWLRDATVEQIRWGLDCSRKTLAVAEPSPGLLVANCGSAVRSSAWIGRTLAAQLA